MANSLEKIISGIVRERFKGAEIDSISVSPDLDSDGDPILRVTVVLTSDVSQLESSKLAGLTRHVRAKIVNRKDAAFPIFRFMTKSDSDRLKRAAA